MMKRGPFKGPFLLTRCFYIVSASKFVNHDFRKGEWY